MTDNIAEERGMPVGGIPKTPLPTAVSWEAVQFTNPENGEQVVMAALSFATPQGSSTYFLPYENLRAMNDGLSRMLAEMPAGTPARAKLIVPQVDVNQVLKAVENGQKKGVQK